MKHRWIAAWLIQIVEMAAVCLVQALSHGAGAGLYAALLWGAVPLAGMLTACRAVRRGLLNYAAWIAPPACLFAVHYAVWRFSPAPGAGILTAFLSLIGAAAGEVLRLRKDGKDRRPASGK